MKFPQINVKFPRIIMKIEKNGISSFSSYEGLREYIRSPMREAQRENFFTANIALRAIRQLLLLLFRAATQLGFAVMVIRTRELADSSCSRGSYLVVNVHTQIRNKTYFCSLFTISYFSRLYFVF